MNRIVPTVALILFACSTAPAPIATPAPSPPPAAATPAATVTPSVAAERLSADSPRTTSSGATFTAPSGWTLRSQGESRILEGPEPNLRLALVDSKAANADAAVAAAWPVLDPNFKRPVKVSLSPPARDGWEEARRFIYETSPNERMVVTAGALRKGQGWTVVVIQADEAAFQRRAAQVQLLLQSLRPQGYTRESFKGKTAHPLDQARIKVLTEFVEHARDELGIPGVGVSLVQDGKVVFQGGLGVRELGKPERIDADTLFLIASNTKALTTLLLAKLVDGGKMAWDTAVTTVYPPFKLGDPTTTSKVLVRHLVCACTGMPRQDYEWLFEFAHATPKSELELLGTFQPTTRFGELYQYSNGMAAAAGYVAGYALEPKRELGAAYDQAMRKLVFDPLGMKRTTFDFARAQRENHAWPHAEDVDGKPQVAAMDINRAAIPIRPAGGAWSSVRELTRYVQMELARGKLPNGKRYVSEENLLARRAPQVAVGEDGSYGMGLIVSTRYGIPVVQHGGSLIGFKSNMFWLPEQGVGGVILTNADTGGVLTGAFIRKVLEVLFDGRDEAAEDLATAARNRKAVIAKERARLVLPPDPAVVSKLATRYLSPALGEVVVRPSGKALVLDFGEWKSAVATRKNDDGTTSLRTIDPGVDGFSFVISQHEGKRALILRDAQHEYPFLEKP